MARPVNYHHIGHFSESLNHLLLKLRFPQFYPIITDLYLPEYSTKVYEWSKVYLSLLLSLFPNDLSPQIHLGNSISIKSMTCFKSIVEFIISL